MALLSPPADWATAPGCAVVGPSTEVAERRGEFSTETTTASIDRVSSLAPSPQPRPDSPYEASAGMDGSRAPSARDSKRDTGPEKEQILCLGRESEEAMDEDSASLCAWEVVGPDSAAPPSATRLGGASAADHTEDSHPRVEGDVETLPSAAASEAALPPPSFLSPRMSSQGDTSSLSTRTALGADREGRKGLQVAHTENKEAVRETQAEKLREKLRVMGSERVQLEHEPRAGETESRNPLQTVAASSRILSFADPPAVAPSRLEPLAYPGALSHCGRLLHDLLSVPAADAREPWRVPRRAASALSTGSEAPRSSCDPDGEHALPVVTISPCTSISVDFASSAAAVAGASLLEVEPRGSLLTLPQGHTFSPSPVRTRSREEVPIISLGAAFDVDEEPAGPAGLRTPSSFSGRVSQQHRPGAFPLGPEEVPLFETNINSLDDFVHVVEQKQQEEERMGFGAGGGAGDSMDNADSAEGSKPDEELVPCSLCKRNFAAWRLPRHAQACARAKEARQAFLRRQRALNPPRLIKPAGSPRQQSVPSSQSQAKKATGAAAGTVAASTAAADRRSVSLSSFKGSRRNSRSDGAPQGEPAHADAPAAEAAGVDALHALSPPAGQPAADGESKGVESAAQEGVFEDVELPSSAAAAPQETSRRDMRVDSEASSALEPEVLSETVIAESCSDSEGMPGHGGLRSPVEQLPSSVALDVSVYASSPLSLSYLSDEELSLPASRRGTKREERCLFVQEELQSSEPDEGVASEGEIEQCTLAALADSSYSLSENVGSGRPQSSPSLWRPSSLSISFRSSSSVEDESAHEDASRPSDAESQVPVEESRTSSQALSPPLSMSADDEPVRDSGTAGRPRRGLLGAPKPAAAAPESPRQSGDVKSPLAAPSSLAPRAREAEDLEEPETKVCTEEADEVSPAQQHNEAAEAGGCAGASSALRESLSLPVPEPMSTLKGSLSSLSPRSPPLCASPRPPSRSRSLLPPRKRLSKASSRSASAGSAGEDRPATRQEACSKESRTPGSESTQPELQPPTVLEQRNAAARGKHAPKTAGARAASKPPAVKREGLKNVRPEDRWKMQPTAVCPFCSRTFSVKAHEGHVKVCERMRTSRTTLKPKLAPSPKTKPAAELKKAASPAPTASQPAPKRVPIWLRATHAHAKAKPADEDTEDKKVDASGTKRLAAKAAAAGAEDRSQRADKREARVGQKKPGTEEKRTPEAALRERKGREDWSTREKRGAAHGSSKGDSAQRARAKPGERDSRGRGESGRALVNPEASEASPTDAAVPAGRRCYSEGSQSDSPASRNAVSPDSPSASLKKAFFQLSLARLYAGAPRPEGDVAPSCTEERRHASAERPLSLPAFPPLANPLTDLLFQMFMMGAHANEAKRNLEDGASVEHRFRLPSADEDRRVSRSVTAHPQLPAPPPALQDLVHSLSIRAHAGRSEAESDEGEGVRGTRRSFSASHGDASPRGHSPTTSPHVRLDEERGDNFSQAGCQRQLSAEELVERGDRKPRSYSCVKQPPASSWGARREAHALGEEALVHEVPWGMLPREYFYLKDRETGQQGVRQSAEKSPGSISRLSSISSGSRPAGSSSEHSVATLDDEDSELEEGDEGVAKEAPCHASSGLKSNRVAAGFSSPPNRSASPLRRGVSSSGSRSKAVPPSVVQRNAVKRIHQGRVVSSTSHFDSPRGDASVVSHSSGEDTEGVLPGPELVQAGSKSALKDLIRRSRSQLRRLQSEKDGASRGEAGSVSAACVERRQLLRQERPGAAVRGSGEDKRNAVGSPRRPAVSEVTPPGRSTRTPMQGAARTASSERGDSTPRRSLSKAEVVKAGSRLVAVPQWSKNKLRGLVDEETEIHGQRPGGVPSAGSPTKRRMCRSDSRVERRFSPTGRHTGVDSTPGGDQSAVNGPEDSYLHARAAETPRRDPEHLHDVRSHGDSSKRMQFGDINPVGGRFSDAGFLHTPPTFDVGGARAGTQPPFLGLDPSLPCPPSPSFSRDPLPSSCATSSSLFNGQAFSCGGQEDQRRASGQWESVSSMRGSASARRSSSCMDYAASTRQPQRRVVACDRAGPDFASRDRPGSPPQLHQRSDARAGEAATAIRRTSCHEGGGDKRWAAEGFPSGVVEALSCSVTGDRSLSGTSWRHRAGRGGLLTPSPWAAGSGADDATAPALGTGEVGGGFFGGRLPSGGAQANCERPSSVSAFRGPLAPHSSPAVDCGGGAGFLRRSAGTSAAAVPCAASKAAYPSNLVEYRETIVPQPYRPPQLGDGATARAVRAAKEPVEESSPVAPTERSSAYRVMGSSLNLPPMLGLPRSASPDAAESDRGKISHRSSARRSHASSLQNRTRDADVELRVPESVSLASWPHEMAAKQATDLPGACRPTPTSTLGARPPFPQGYGHPAPTGRPFADSEEAQRNGSSTLHRQVPTFLPRAHAVAQVSGSAQGRSDAASAGCIGGARGVSSEQPIGAPGVVHWEYNCKTGLWRRNDEEVPGMQHPPVRAHLTAKVGGTILSSVAAAPHVIGARRSASHDLALLSTKESGEDVRSLGWLSAVPSVSSPPVVEQFTALHVEQSGVLSSAGIAGFGASPADQGQGPPPLQRQLQQRLLASKSNRWDVSVLRRKAACSGAGTAVVLSGRQSAEEQEKQPHWRSQSLERCNLSLVSQPMVCDKTGGEPFKPARWQPGTGFADADAHAPPAETRAKSDVMGSPHKTAAKDDAGSSIFPRWGGAWLRATRKMFSSAES
ncbi:hypothetical protein BESB_036520 [Besnoitia besnoiti]|uniref:C2HC/C3H-type domain-containing protein n=1 Tax=Besnoitia besnoiti TaxID=94643 RepID=A0A2A9MJ23_BESBE|nr:hypothetical protein BESB_036520 [Besnoitia besnoiti]PFH37194.1 hypothetical protein BESB_036520 [Besnoitia besnoiti]